MDLTKKKTLQMQARCSFDETFIYSHYPSMENSVPHPLFLNVSTSHMKLEDYDGTTDWLKYKVYFDQLAKLYFWD